MCDSQSSSLPPTRLLQLQQQQQQQPCLDTEARRCTHTSAAGSAAVPACTQGARCEHGASWGTPARQHDGTHCAAAQAVCESKQCDDFMAGGEAPAAPKPTTAGCQAAQVAGRDQADYFQDEAATRTGYSLETGDQSQQGGLASDDGDQKRLRQLEMEHVHRVYEAIAPHFSATRCAVGERAVIRVRLESGRYIPGVCEVLHMGCLWVPAGHTSFAARVHLQYQKFRKGKKISVATGRRGAPFA